MEEIKKNATKTHDLTLMCRLRIRKRVSLAWWKRITRLTRMLAIIHLSSIIRRLPDGPNSRDRQVILG